MTDKLNKSADAKEVVLYYYEAINSQVDNSIGRYTKSIKSLLDEYNVEELKYAIDYCVKHQPNGGIYSFGFVTWTIKEKGIINDLRKQKLIAKQKEEESKPTTLKPLPGPSDNSKKLNKFGKDKEFDWNA